MKEEEEKFKMKYQTLTKNEQNCLQNIKLKIKKQGKIELKEFTTEETQIVKELLWLDIFKIENGYLFWKDNSTKILLESSNLSKLK